MGYLETSEWNVVSQGILVTKLIHGLGLVLFPVACLCFKTADVCKYPVMTECIDSVALCVIVVSVHGVTVQDRKRLWLIKE